MCTDRQTPGWPWSVPQRPLPCLQGRDVHSNPWCWCAHRGRAAVPSDRLLQVQVSDEFLNFQMMPGPVGFDGRPPADQRQPRIKPTAPELPTASMWHDRQAARQSPSVKDAALLTGLVLAACHVTYSSILTAKPWPDDTHRQLPASLQFCM